MTQGRRDTAPLRWLARGTQSTERGEQITGRAHRSHPPSSLPADGSHPTGEGEIHEWVPERQAASLAENEVRPWCVIACAGYCDRAEVNAPHVGWIEAASDRSKIGSLAAPDLNQ